MCLPNGKTNMPNTMTKELFSEEDVKNLEGAEPFGSSPEETEQITEPSQEGEDNTPEEEQESDDEPLEKGIPYERFKAVNDEKKAALQELESRI